MLPPKDELLQHEKKIQAGYHLFFPVYASKINILFENNSE